MSNALNDSAPRPSPAYTQASPDIGGMPGGVVPLSDGTANALAPQPSLTPGNALGGTPQQPPQVPQPAPTHEQTVIALHHTAEVSQQLMALMRDPELGKKDARSEIVDVALELVQKGLATVPAVVEQVKNLPSDPQGQLNWVKAHLMANQLSQFAVLEHYRAANPPTYDAAGDTAAHGALFNGKNRKGHGDVMRSLIDHYQGAR